MGITCRLKQVTSSTLDLLRENPLLVDLFFAAQDLPESKRFQKVRRDRSKYLSHYNLQILEQQFLAEWEIPELDLDKHFSDLTFLLAGYVPGYISAPWTISELRPLAECYQSQGILPFLVIEESEWDGCSLVNAIEAGNDFEYPPDFDNEIIYCSSYLLPGEVGQILDGFLLLSEEDFQERYRRESQKSESSPAMNWSEEEIQNCFADRFEAMNATLFLNGSPPLTEKEFQEFYLDRLSDLYLDEFEEETLSFFSDYFNRINCYYEDAVRRKNGMLIDYCV